MSGFSRQLPKKVQQYKDTRFTCWAAALESWMSVTPQSPASWFIKTQDDAIKEWKGFTQDNGGLEVKWGFALMAAAVGMTFKVYKPATKISGATIYQKLKTKSHIYLFFAGGITMASGQMGHCVVIYGINDPFSNECTVDYMDPWFGGYEKDKPLSYFQGANEAVVAWLE